MRDPNVELKQRHGGTWGECPMAPVRSWQAEVANGDTRRGYWDWVAAQIESSQQD